MRDLKEKFSIKKFIPHAMCVKSIFFPNQDNHSVTLFLILSFCYTFSGDNTVCSEEDVLLAETNSLTVEPCHDSAFDDEQTVSSHPKEVLCEKNEILKMNCTDDMDTDESYHESEGDEMERLNLNDGKISKHNEDAANNNGNHDGEENGEEETDKSEQPDQLSDGAFAPGYFSLEALQKMAQFVSAAIANNSDNEDAQKQLAVLQTTLFTLQHQQLFQLQLIQQLQSQLSINRSDKDDDDVDEEDEREEGELTQEQMDEEQRKYEEEQRQIRKEEEESLKAKKESMADKEKEGFQPLNPNLPIGPNDSISAMEASFSSAFASTIITNHDQPSTMEGLNSLEMLQKRAEEVLDSASRGILSGSLADEMSFKNDGKGRNEPFFKHRCRFCGKVFGSDSALQIHIRSHTGERPFKCNVCGSRFTTKGNLKVHFQRHTQKFPHINMNPHPIPEHLDKFYPPLLPPLPPGQQPPISPPPPQSSRPPAPMNLPFPPIPGLPPGLQGFQGIPGLPLFRPPFDLLKQMGAHPFFGAIRDAVHHEQRQEVQKQQTEEQLSPADLSKPPLTISPKIKDEPKEESVSPQPSEETQNSIEPKLNEEVVDKQKSSESPTALWKENLRKDCISPAKSIEGYSSPKEQPENLSKISAKLSPSSIGSLRDNHIMDNQNEIKIFPSMMPRPGSTDNSWESYIEVDKSSETSKLQQLVDNIENKITDPNECCVCHKVLSCRSALQMHYRTHTGKFYRILHQRTKPIF